MGFSSAWHWIIVLLVVVIIFGAGKIPRVMGDVAKGIKSFKAGLKDDDTASVPTTNNDVDHHDRAEHGSDQAADQARATEADQPQHGAADEAADEAEDHIADDRATADLNWLRLHDVASQPAGDASHHQADDQVEHDSCLAWSLGSLVLGAE